MIAPVLVYDSRERWFPIAVDEALRKIMQPGDMAAFLRGAASEGGRIDFPRDMAPEWFKDSPPVGYHRIQKGGGLWWSCFWMFYAYNPWEVAGVGKHEGDWEAVFLGCTDEAGDHPVLVTCSQHHSGGKREAWTCQDAAGQPVIHVACGSHANYFTKGAHGGIDFSDGHGLILGRRNRPIEWRPFGPWASWPGRWGNSDNSPQSPARQGHRWSAPHLYHASAVAQ